MGEQESVFSFSVTEMFESFKNLEISLAIRILSYKYGQEGRMFYLDSDKAV